MSADSKNLLPPAIFLMGSTATGKTDLAAEIAKRIDVDVISVDSALIYRDMDIGTAKPDADFLAHTPHKLIDIIDPDQAYSVADFRRDCLSCMHEAVSSGKVPLLVGGTMMYFKALIEGLADMPSTNPVLRQQLDAEAKEKGWPAMHAKLAKLDPVVAEKIHPNHSQRIQRALEVCLSSGSTMTAMHQSQPSEPLPFNVLQMAIVPEYRAQLHERIALRFQLMMQRGFIEEMHSLRSKYPLNAEMMSMRAVGYRQAWQYLAGELSEPEFVEKAIIATRQLAKRQLTWLRNWPDLYIHKIDFEHTNFFERLVSNTLLNIRENSNL